MNEFKDGTLYRVAISDLFPNEDQPRKFFCPEAQANLENSIKEHNLLTPISFTIKGDKKIILDGERRWRALNELGHDTISGLFIKNPFPALPLVANLQREDLLPLEKAEILQTLKETHDYSLEDLAKIIGKSVTTVSETLKLNCLTDEIKNECRTSKRYVSSRLLEIAKLSTSRAQNNKFKKYKDSLDGNSKKRASKKGANLKSMTQRLDLFIKDFDEIEPGSIGKNELDSWTTKIAELNRLVAEKLRHIEALAASGFRREPETDVEELQSEMEPTIPGGSDFTGERTEIPEPENGCENHELADPGEEKIILFNEADMERKYQYEL